MKASVFDQQHSPTLSVQEGYTTWAATYDEMKAGSLMDYPLLARIQAVSWGQLEAVMPSRKLCKNTDRPHEVSGRATN